MLKMPTHICESACAAANSHLIGNACAALSRFDHSYVGQHYLLSVVHPIANLCDSLGIVDGYVDADKCINTCENWITNTCVGALPTGAMNRLNDTTQSTCAQNMCNIINELDLEQIPTSVPDLIDVGVGVAGSVERRLENVVSQGAQALTEDLGALDDATKGAGWGFPHWWNSEESAISEESAM